MSAKASELLVLFLIKLVAALVESHKRRLKTEEERQAFEVVVESARTARTRQEKSDAAERLSNSFD